MKFKCIELEAETKRFTLGKVYHSNSEGFITADNGRLFWMSPTSLMIMIGEEKLNRNLDLINTEPRFAYFEIL